MIINASRRTDIPSYYSEWFLNKIKEGYLDVRNPMNAHQISRINLSPDVVDCIVFWTKNPIPMLPRLGELSDYTYYFQFTLTGYGKDIEKNLPDKWSVLIPAFEELSSKIGKERVIWRYDPILFNEKYNMKWHIEMFDRISRELEGYTEKCVISFVDIYAKNKKNIQGQNVVEPDSEELNDFAAKIAGMAHSRGMDMATCAEAIDLDACGISHNQCIDKALIERLTGHEMNVKKDPTQRIECGCMASIDVGSYNTCRNGCIYCYANYNPSSVADNCRKYDPDSPILCGTENAGEDKINLRKVKSLKGDPLNGPEQISMFDMPGGEK
jgi:hypothetical protein